MKTKLLLLITLSAISCIDEDYFGLSNYGNIKTITVSNQANLAIIKTDERAIEVEIPGGVDLSVIAIQELTLSSFATADKKVGDILNLQAPQNILVIAEDGSEHNWTITAFVASSTPQLANGDMNKWYKTNTNYYEPGESASNTIWGTGNPGTQILNKLATIPEDLGSGNLAAKMITLDNGVLAATFGTPISAGSVFTGKFNPDNIDPSNPQAAIDFGVPFAGRPVKIKLKYKYEAGETNKDKDGNVLGYPDMLDIYALLEVRTGGNVERLATAWFRSADETTTLTTKEILFTYGELDGSFPDYMRPGSGGYVSQEAATFILPTHITFVASSSYDGANFAGAIGSTLIIDDIELIYE